MKTLGKFPFQAGILYQIFASFAFFNSLSYLLFFLLFLHSKKKYQQLDKLNQYSGCRKISVFQVWGVVGKNPRNLEKIK
jgi:hypothetical protein